LSGRQFVSALAVTDQFAGEADSSEVDKQLRARTQEEADIYVAESRLVGYYRQSRPEERTT